MKADVALLNLHHGQRQRSPDAVNERWRGDLEIAGHVPHDEGFRGLLAQHVLEGRERRLELGPGDRGKLRCGRQTRSLLLNGLGRG